MRPIVRYFGGKFLLAPWIISFMPKHRVYVEPFGGAGSVLMRKPRSYAEIYNDIDDSVFSLFQVLRDPETAARLRHLLEFTPFCRRELELARSYTPDPVERARRIIIRSFMGFGCDSAINRHRNTGFRGNANRSGSTPAHDWVNYAKEIDFFCARLRGVVLEHRGAQQVMSTYDGADTVHFLDPPYMAETRSKGRAKNYNFEMSLEDHAELLAHAVKMQGAVMISGYSSPLYEDTLRGWHREQKAALADGAQKRTEVLWMNW